MDSDGRWRAALEGRRAELEGSCRGELEGSWGEDDAARFGAVAWEWSRVTDVNAWMVHVGRV